MNIREISEIQRKGEDLHYRRRYTATARLEHVGSDNCDVPIEFVLEHTALGETHLSVSIRADIDYPRVPLLRALKEHIHHLDRERKLP